MNDKKETPEPIYLQDMDLIARMMQAGYNVNTAFKFVVSTEQSTNRRFVDVFYQTIPLGYQLYTGDLPDGEYPLPTLQEIDLPAGFEIRKSNNGKLEVFAITHEAYKVNLKISEYFELKPFENELIARAHAWLYATENKENI